MKLLVLMAILACAYAMPANHKYKTGGGPVPDKLNVHLVAHTHDDVGWLKTVDEYYMGANNSIQNAGVQYILDSVMLALDANPDRKFIYVEIAFFLRWWRQQTPEMQVKVRGFVEAGRLEFINGGWSMNDEASTYYRSIIDNMAIGHEFLKETFGVTPTIGWHIDPFGHSAAQASLFASMGFDAFYFGRIDYQDKDLRLKQQRMEMMWQGSASQGLPNAIFTGVLANGYGPPDGFNWNSGSGDAPIQDDPRLFDENVKSRVDDFVKAAQDQQTNYRTNHILMTMGSDFEYENANTWFKNLDKLIHYVNADGRINVFYSTPTIYTKQKNDAKLKWELKTDDFFPYSDCEHCMWTGYFVSRVAVKKYVRDMDDFLQTCRQTEIFDTAQVPAGMTSRALKEAVGVTQHHDAVTGTEKQHVAFDYAKRLAIGQANCEKVVTGAWGTMVGSVPLTMCPLLNVSICDASESAAAGVTLSVVVYNPQAQERDHYVHVPLKRGVTHVSVLNEQGKEVVSQVVELPQERNKLVDTVATHEAVFKMHLPALGYNTYFVTAQPSGEWKEERPAQIVKGPKDDTVLENAHIALTFDATSGRLKHAHNKDKNVAIDIDQQFLYYTAFPGTKKDDQASGAYIFRPSEQTATEIGSTATIKSTVSGGVVSEVRQEFAPWLVQTVRLHPDHAHATFETTVGPIPFQDGIGREVISRFKTSIASADTFYTDSNGREMMERRVNFRPTWKLNVTEPVSGNYYPINSRAFIKDSAAQLTVVTDRSCGGGSLKPGELEIMIHRRTLHDDHRGVGEPMNETGLHGLGLVTSLSHNLILDTPADSAAQHRPLAIAKYAQPRAMFAPITTNVTEFIRTHRVNYTAAAMALPPNVNLLTLEMRSSSEALLRLEHIYAVDEDAKYSTPATVDLSTLFSAIGISSAVELSLSGNQPEANVHRLSWITGSDSAFSTARVTAAGPKAVSQSAPNDLTVTLKPMEIKTFEVTFHH